MCGQKAEYREGYHPDGTVRYKGYFIGKEPQGEVTHYYPEGTIKAVMNHNGSETTARLYSKDGKFFTSGKYIDRKKTGEWEYRTGDRLLMKDTYQEDKLNGSSYRYDKSSAVAELRTWKSGMLSGPWVLYYDNGNTRFETSYVNGKLEGKIRSNTYEGKLSVEGQYRNNLKDGVWRYYNADGSLQKEIKYVDGKPENDEAEEMKENQEVDRIVSEGRKIPDPANFVNEPDVYMRYAE
ncbi:hypothetical protein LJC62_03175 [Odoribacter sp. OttesenSCG-928-A06]|nr:hypothetical protein [Odoribacter sp. OttesenSCG-928-A06]